MKFSVTLLSSLLLLGASAQKAAAHIDLTYPPMASGSNQKGAAPCGGGGAAPVTTFKPGETITVKFTETIYHPGHFRIAILGDGITAPADPTGYTDIKEPAVMPILSDGLHKHTSGARKAWEAQVTLPNMTCTKCSLQLIQVMQQGTFDGSPGGSLYRRCANIVLAGSASPADGGAPDSGGASDASSGSGGAGGSSGGTGGSSGGTGGSSGSTGGSSGSTGGSSGSTGGSSGSGGTTAGSGGTTGSGGSPAGSGGSSGTARGGSTGSTTPSSSDAGGGCSVGGSERHPGAWALLALVMGVGFASRRRRR